MISLYLSSRKDRQGRRYIMARYSNRGTFRFYTGVKIHPNEWDAKKGRPKKNSPFYGAVTDSLLKKEREISLLISEAIKKGLEPDAPTIKGLYRSMADMARDQRNSSHTGDFTLRWREYLRALDIQEGTLRQYLQVEAEFTEFNGAPVFPVKSALLEDFYTWLEDEKGNSPNTATRKVKKLVAFLNFASRQGWCEKPSYIPKYTEGRKKPPLEWEEVVFLIDYQPKEKSLYRAKDFFCLLCFTGIRFSEAQQVTEDSINKVDNTLEIYLSKQGKATKWHNIALTQEALIILETWGYRFPPFQTVGEFNRDLRKLFKEAYETTGNLGRIVVFGEEVKPLYQVVSSHTGRNTLINKLFQEGLSANDIAGITGQSGTGVIARHYFHTNAKKALKRHLWALGER